MQLKKKGLSDVVTTVLIILLVLAAVAIIWGYLRNTLVESGGQITSSCLTLDLAPVSCTVNATTVNVRYGRDAGDASLKNTSLIFTVNGNNVVVTASNIPKPLEVFTQNIALSSSTFNNVRPTAFSVAGTVTTESGDEKLCPQSQTISCS